ncbi:MAG TPA: TA system VapC family ribonuclease toxin [Opitutaceae bacterium]|nr:TA system VapC family ribonuclease toxin [Opitutaceae bacterium]
MKGYLLDVNVLIALAWPNHPQHVAAHAWFGLHHSSGWGTCMVTQLGFVRVSSHPSLEHHVSTHQAWEKLKEIVALPTHAFWAEPAGGCANAAFSGTIPRILTHGLVIDGYLATIAELNAGKVATFDRPFARAFGAQAAFIETPS